jgi:hypothetical protein
MLSALPAIRRTAAILGVFTLGAGACSDPVAPPVVDHTTEVRTLVSCTVGDCRSVASRQIGSTTVRVTGAIATPCAVSAVLRASATSQSNTLTLVVADSGGVRSCTPAGSPLPIEVLIRNVPSGTSTLIVRGAIPADSQQLQITTSSAAPN